MNAPSLPPVGSLFAGKYELVRRVGAGGMGTVFEARHHRLQSRVAIKFLHPALCANADHVARFEREARAVARLRSENVIGIHDVDTTPSGMPYMVMEFLEGRDLAQELSTRQEIPLGEVIDLVLQVCAGVAAAHGAGIVHRDLKPRNVFLTEHEGRRVVKVLDFGVSKFVGAGSDAEQTEGGVVVGTPQYMSPEQVLGDRSIDERTDVWALGVLLFRMLTHRYPFSGEHPSQLAVAIVTEIPTPVTCYQDVPAAVADAITKALRRDREERFADVASFARAIAPFGTEGRFPAGSSGRFPALVAAQQAQQGGDAEALTRSIASSPRGAPRVENAPSGALLVRDALSAESPSSAPAAKSRAPVAIAVAVALVAAVGGVLALRRPPSGAAPVPSSPSPTTASHLASNSPEVAASVDASDTTPISMPSSAQVLRAPTVAPRPAARTAIPRTSASGTSASPPAAPSRAVPLHL